MTRRGSAKNGAPWSRCSLRLGGETRTVAGLDGARHREASSAATGNVCPVPAQAVHKGSDSGGQE